MEIPQDTRHAIATSECVVALPPATELRASSQYALAQRYAVIDRERAVRTLGRVGEDHLVDEALDGGRLPVRVALLELASRLVLGRDAAEQVHQVRAIEIELRLLHVFVFKDRRGLDSVAHARHRQRVDRGAERYRDSGRLRPPDVRGAREREARRLALHQRNVDPRGSVPSFAVALAPRSIGAKVLGHDARRREAQAQEGEEDTQPRRQLAAIALLALSNALWRMDNVAEPMEIQVPLAGARLLSAGRTRPEHQVYVDGRES